MAIGASARVRRLVACAGVLVMGLGSGVAWGQQGPAPIGWQQDLGGALGMTDTGMQAAPAKPALRAYSTRLGGAAVGGLNAAVGQVALGPIDVQALRIEDEAAAQRGDKSLRYGIGRDLMATIDNGAWTALADGSAIWTLDVAAQGAIALRARLWLDLPEGCEAVVYSPSDPERVYGPFDRKGWFNGAEMWTPTTAGERVRIEVFVPRERMGTLGKRPVFVDRVQHVYRDPIAEGALRVPSQCQQVACQFPTWTNIATASAGIGTIGNNSLFCSGTMMNTLVNDLTPYWLTANHCLSTASAANNSEIFWQYQAATCGGSVPALTSVPRSSVCTLVSTGATSDYTLLLIEGALPSTRYFSGWVGGNPSAGTAVAGVHHPAGADKKISFGTNSSGANPCSATGHVRADWTSSGTEPGSSGSGLFVSSTQQLYGHLHCGPSSCAPTASNDGYGSFVTDFTNGAVSSALNSGGSDDALENNDTCATARAMGGGTSTNLVVKSVDPDWYRVTLGPNQQLTAALSFTHAWGDIDELLYTTCGGGAVASSTGTGNTESLTYTNTGGSNLDVYLNVYLYGGGSYPDTRNQYSMTLTITNVPPANNNCAAATAIGVGSTAFTTINATTDGPTETLCNNAGSNQVTNDVWYRYTHSGCSGVVTASLCGATFDTKLAVYGSSCPSVADTAIACNDDSAACGGNGLQSWLTFPAVTGQQYLLRVGGFNGATGTGSVTISPPAPANNACAAAITLPGSGAYVVDTCGATTDGPDDGAVCLSAGSSQTYNDVWYRYNAPCTTAMRVRTCGSAFDTRISVYGSACPGGGAGLALACNDDACGLQSRVVFNSAAGSSYLIRLGSFGSATTGVINFRVGYLADWDENGAVDPADIALFINDWLADISGGTINSDTDNNFAIDPADIATFVNAWLSALAVGC